MLISDSLVITRTILEFTFGSSCNFANNSLIMKCCQKQKSHVGHSCIKISTLVILVGNQIIKLNVSSSHSLLEQ